MAENQNSDRVEVLSFAETTATPSLPTAGSVAGVAQEAKVYLKANNLVILFNDAGTARYMYLPLDAAAAAWAYSATEPT